jgi:hypothetical protein
MDNDGSAYGMVRIISRECNNRTCIRVCIVESIRSESNRRNCVDKGDRRTPNAVHCRLHGIILYYCSNTVFQYSVLGTTTALNTIMPKCQYKQ